MRALGLQLENLNKKQSGFDAMASVLAADSFGRGGTSSFAGGTAFAPVAALPGQELDKVGLLSGEEREEAFVGLAAGAGAGAAALQSLDSGVDASTASDALLRRSEASRGMGSAGKGLEVIIPVSPLAAAVNASSSSSRGGASSNSGRRSGWCDCVSSCLGRVMSLLKGERVRRDAVAAQGD